MALPASATFTGTNGTAVRTLTDWDGARSTSFTGGGTVIQSNAAQADARTGVACTGADWWTSDTFDADQYSTATVTAMVMATAMAMATATSAVTVTATAPAMAMAQRSD